MKSVITSIVIFILIVVMVISSTWYTNVIADSLLQYLYKIENNFSVFMWSAIYNDCEKISSIWNKNRTMMSVIFNHQIIDELDVCIEKLKNTAKLKETHEFIYEKDTLKLILISLKEQQKISIGNIM